MEYFSLDVDDPLKEIEKETLSSGKGIKDLKKIMELIRLGSRPRRHIRHVIAAAIIVMERINRQAPHESPFFSVRSYSLALELKGSMAPGDNYIKARDRNLLLQDLGELLMMITAVVDSSQSSAKIDALRDFLRPETNVFDEVGRLCFSLKDALMQAGARTIAVSSTAGERFRVDVEGTTSEEEFLRTFNSLSISRLTGGTPPIVYQQLDCGRITEDSDAVIQMGDWSSRVYLLGDQIPDHVKQDFGDIGNGTIGALLTLKESHASGWEKSDGSILFGMDDSEEEEGACAIVEEEQDVEKSPFGMEFVKGQEINEGVWTITAAHVAFSKLSMSTVNSPAEEDRNKRMKSFCPVKLHASPQYNSLSDWSPYFLNVDDDITVVKIGAKTGFTVGKYAGVKESVLDTEGAHAEYLNCVAVKHAERDCGRFCKPGDSGSIYFALLPSDKDKIHDRTHNMLEWVPIAIHRTSDRNYSYGSPLMESINALVNEGKLKRSDTKILYMALQVMDCSS